MVAHEPRVRRRGFFLHAPDSNEPDTGDYENAEGFGVRVRATSTSVPRQIASTGRSRTTSRIESTNPQIRSGSVTGSRQRAHLPR